MDRAAEPGTSGGMRSGDIVTAKIARYDPDRDRTLRWQTWKVAWAPGMTVLDLLFHIKETQDGSLAFRAACRMANCGSCGMHVNGRPRLACDTQIAELGRRIVVGPLLNHDVIKDLVPDLDPIFERHRAVQPYLIRDGDSEKEHPAREYRQTPAEMTAYIQFAACITCGLCLAACPVTATDQM
ncbi:MAG TPA: 2Fe-2S iron-sulfur cluster-binding protein, partial [bacterium]|nr:2Fe-2S iron-sulfur cluster-binding protein [bacterium]